MYVIDLKQATLDSYITDELSTETIKKVFSDAVTQYRVAAGLSRILFAMQDGDGGIAVQVGWHPNDPAPRTGPSVNDHLNDAINTGLRALTMAAGESSIARSRAMAEKSRRELHALAERYPHLVDDEMREILSK